MTLPETTDRVAEIRRRHDVIRVRAWEAMPHQHGTPGCRCLSCYDDPTGWVMDHPSALACDEQPAAPGVDSGRDRESCDFGPLLSYEEADALAHAADDIGFLLGQSETHRLALSEALGLGTGAPWDAIEERAAELSTASLAAPAAPAASANRAAVQYWFDAATERRAERDQLRAVVARLRQMTDYWERQLPDVIRTLAVVSAIRAALPAAAPFRATADEVQRPEVREVVHAWPTDASGLTPCCGRTPLELPLTDQIGSEAPATCPGPAEAQQPEQFTEAERGFLAYALHLADEQMVTGGGKFSAEDRAALVMFQRLAKAGCTCDSITEAWVEMPHAADCLMAEGAQS